MNFGPWEIPNDEFLECCLRLDRAMGISQNSIGPVDIDSGSVQILGSGLDPYTVTLHGCQCTDYQRRGLPCKHMIRLALELGLSFDIPQFDPYAASSYDVEADIAQLTDRWRAGQLTLDSLAKCAAALRASASKAKRPRGRPKKAV